MQVELLPNKRKIVIGGFLQLRTRSVYLNLWPLSLCLTRDPRKGKPGYVRCWGWGSVGL